MDGISNESPSTVRYTDRDAARGDVIQDAEDERDIGDSRRDILDEEVDNTPTASVELDSEFEDLFGPLERTKRRRISPAPEADNAPSRDYRGVQNDTILTSSPGPDSQSCIEEPPVTPFPRRPRPTQQLQFQDEGIPAGTPKPSTPATTKPAFRHHPRFLLSQQPPSSTQTSPASAPVFASQPPSSTPRRKPAFVLPRSPSPSATQEDIASLSTPFSPSRTLRRRGRARNDVPGYVPGGMAAEVRGWVLEMGTKREQLDSSVGRFDAQGVVDSRKYFVTARVVRVVRSVLRSSGAVAFVEAELLSKGSILEDAERRNLLLMGFPRSRSGDFQLGQGSVVGVYRGLVWEIDLDRDGVDHLVKYDLGVADVDSHQPSAVNDRERWLVVMEWDLL